VTSECEGTELFCLPGHWRSLGVMLRTSIHVSALSSSKQLFWRIEEFNILQASTFTIVAGSPDTIAAYHRARYNRPC
jgi:hypothetical protein